MAYERVTIDVSSAAIFRVILIAVAFWFVYQILDILLMLFAAIVVASAMDPVVGWFKRKGVPRGLSLAVIYLLAIGMISGVVALALEPITDQLYQLAQSVPALVNSLHNLVPFIPTLDKANLISGLQGELLKIGDNLANISLNVVQRTSSVVAGLFTVVFVFVLAFYLELEQDSLKKFVRLVTPAKHAAYVESAVERAQRQVGRWMLAQLALGAIIGLTVGVTLAILGVPYALLLGFLAGILEIVPYIGPILSAIIGTLVGFSQSLILGVLALVVYVVVQQLENHVVVPNVMKRAVGLHPLATIIAILLGARLAGVVGIMLAIPMATVVSVVISDIFAPKPN